MNFLPKKKTTSKKKRSKRMQPSLSFQKLEPRKLLATVNLTGGVLKIVGTQINDNVEIFDINGQTFGMVVNGNSFAYQYSNVSRVQFLGGQGNDYIDNQSRVRSQFNGEGGNDTIKGGWTNDYLVGGSGDDLIVARNGNDTVLGASGNDRVWGNVGRRWKRLN